MSDLRACFKNSSNSSSRSLFFGIFPTNRRWLLKDMVTPILFPFRSSKSFSYKFKLIREKRRSNDKKWRGEWPFEIEQPRFLAIFFAILPVNFTSSSSISSFPFDLGILPKNKRVFGSLTFTFSSFPSEISYESSCKISVKTNFKGHSPR